MSIISKRLSIPDAQLLTLDRYSDDRGYFQESYATEKYHPLGILDEFVQDNISYSHQHVLRGLHGAHRTAKLVQVLHGAIWDVLVDIRPDSPTFQQWEAVTLSADNRQQLYIPAGCLHGFLTLTDQVIFSYKLSTLYDPNTEFGFRWDDPSFSISWPITDVPCISKKDQEQPTFIAGSR